MSSSRTLTSAERLKKIKLWQQSGKSARAWCRENQIVYTTFMGWNARIKESAEDSSSSLLKTQFIELEEEKKAVSGISLECEGVKIHLEVEFDATSLKKCLAVLRGGLC